MEGEDGRCWWGEYHKATTDGLEWKGEGIELVACASRSSWQTKAAESVRLVHFGVNLTMVTCSSFSQWDSENKAQHIRRFSLSQMKGKGSLAAAACRYLRIRRSDLREGEVGVQRVSDACSGAAMEGRGTKEDKHGIRESPWQAILHTSRGSNQQRARAPQQVAHVWLGFEVPQNMDETKQTREQ